MTKQVHIHIHRTKARDAGEGEGKWITLSPSGTHVKINGKGEVTAGPKGLSLSKKGSAPAAKKSGPDVGAQVKSTTYSGGSREEHDFTQSAKHASRSIRVPASEAPKEIERVTSRLESQGFTKSGTDPLSGAQQFESEGQTAEVWHNNGVLHTTIKNKPAAKKAPHDPTGMAHAGRPQGTAAVQARIDAKKAAGKPVGFAGKAAAGTSKPGPDGKPMGIHPALAAVTPPGFPTPGSQAGNKVRVNQATGELSQVGRVNASSGPDEDALRARVKAAREGMRNATNKAEEQRQELFFEEAMEKLAALQESTKKGEQR